MKDHKLLEELAKRGYLHEIQPGAIDFLGPIEFKNKGKRAVFVVVIDGNIDPVH